MSELRERARGRALRCLEAAGYGVRHVDMMTDRELLRVPGIGVKRLAMLRTLARRWRGAGAAVEAGGVGVL